MVIEVSSATYRKGRGMRLDEIKEPGLLGKLNSIVDWFHSTLPPVSSATDEEWVENREFLGTPPQLKIGTSFKFGNQFLAVEDNNTLVLVISETGIYGLKRVWEDKISKEIAMKEGNNLPESSEYTPVKPKDMPKPDDVWEGCVIPYDIKELLFKERILPGRPELVSDDGKAYLKANIEFSFSVFPSEIYIDSTGKVFYRKAEIEKSWEKLVIKQLTEDLYAKFPVINGEYVNPYQKRNEAMKVAKEMSQKIIGEINEIREQDQAQEDQSNQG